MRAAVIFVFCVYLAIEAFGANNSCPVTKITETDPVILSNMAKASLERLSNSISVSSHEAIELKEYLVLALYSNLKGERDCGNSLIQMSIIWPYLGQNVTACTFAEAINATAAFDITSNKMALQETLNNNQDSYHRSMIEMAVYTAKKASGCTLPPDTPLPRLPNKQCFNNGYTYDIEPIWDTYSTNLDPEIRTLVRALYDSTDVQEQMTAAILTYGILPFRNSMNFGWSVQEGLEMLNLQTDSIIPKRCCAGRLCRLDQVNQTNIAEMDRILSTQKSAYAPPPEYTSACYA